MLRNVKRETEKKKEMKKFSLTVRQSGYKAIVTRRLLFILSLNKFVM